MRILCLGAPAVATPSPLAQFIRAGGDEVFEVSERIAADFVRQGGFDWIVSFGYRHLLRADTLAAVGGRAVNLHASYLPYNRGAHPNFWSFYERTPSGVTVHFIDEGVDTGDIIAQRQLRFDGTETLASSYARLHEDIQALFRETWPSIRAGTCARGRQVGEGTLHRARDLDAHAELLKDGWNTPVSVILAAGPRQLG